jgi:hypothetical protein
MNEIMDMTGGINSANALLGFRGTSKASILGDSLSRGKGFDAVFSEAVGATRIPGARGAGVTDPKLFDTCVEMESLLMFEVLKGLRKTISKSGFLDGGFREDVFQGMLDEQYALTMSKNTKLGLAEVMYRQIQGGV